MREKEFLQQVLDAAGYLGWTVRYHTWLAVHSAAGWPDLALAREHPRPRLVLAEVKTDLRRSPLTPAQREVLTTLRACAGGSLEVYVWLPAHWDALIRVLRPDGPEPWPRTEPLPAFCAWCTPVGPHPAATSTICARHLRQERLRRD